MSPTAAKKSKAKAKALTIEFAGISTLLWNAKTSTARVQLVDLASAGFDRHYAALSMAVTEDAPRGVKGPDADAAVSAIGENKDVGIWNLLGTTVEILGAVGKVTVDDSKIDPAKKPAKKSGSVRWLADVSSLCESEKLDPTCPIASVIEIPAGHITVTGQNAARKLSFTENGIPVQPDRFCVPRFRAVVPFETQLAVRLSRDKVLRFTESAEIVISNTCVCGLGVGPAENHFYGHYDVVQAKRRPKVTRAGKLPTTPQFPEICYSGIVRL